MKHRVATITNTAHWDRARKVYVLKGETFTATSDDGDSWFRDGTGDFEESPEFESAHVLLDGGPRDGAVIR